MDDISKLILLLKSFQGGGFPPQALSPDTKIVTWPEVLRVVESIRSRDVWEGGIVFTCGCFDLFHYGHAQYLTGSVRPADEYVIVAVNSDESVRKVKGCGRPFYTQQQRAFMVACMNTVHLVTVFNDTNAVKMLEELRPDVYLKGGDNTIETINQEERRLVKSYGGSVRLGAHVREWSTSAIAQQLRLGHLKLPEFGYLDQTIKQEKQA